MSGKRRYSNPPGWSPEPVAAGVSGFHVPNRIIQANRVSRAESDALVEPIRASRRLPHGRKLAHKRFTLSRRRFLAETPGGPSIVG